MNMAKLKGKMREMNVTQEELAKHIGISLSSLSRKLQGVGGSVFTINEANKIYDMLQLSSEEAMAIFFADNVA